MRSVLIFPGLWLVFSLCPLEAEPLSVAADSSLRNALKEQAQAWANAHNQEQIELELANDGILREGLVKGQSWDVVILADPAEVKNLTASGFLQAGEQKPLVKNELVALGHKALIEDEQLDWYDLIDQEWSSVAMGDPDKVVSGFCAAAAMQKRGVAKKLKSAPILGGDALDALASAQRNETDAVFLFRSDLPESGVSGYEVFNIDPTDYPPVVYTAALPKNCRQTSMARDFIAFLKSKPAREIWKKWNLAPDH